MSEQGTMTSPTLVELLRVAVSTAYPHVQIEGRDKVAILEDVLASHGWAAVVGIGAWARRLGDHPVVKALVASPSPPALVQRWMLLERFGHTRNRVEIVGAPAADHLVLRHVAADGGTIARVNDLFLWGLLATLLELAGTRGLAVVFGRPDEDGPVLPTSGAGAPASAEPPARTHVITLRWAPAAARPPADHATADDAATTIRARLHELLRRDLLAPWTAAEAARALGLSSRSLQRALQAEGTTFSATLQRARVTAAEALLADGRVSLTEVAFCTGFADQAHFTRTFRKLVDVPPSAFRQVLLASAGRSGAGGAA